MRAESGAAVNLGTVPVYYGGGKLTRIERRLRVAEVVLRCVACGLCVLSVALIASASQSREIFSIQKKANFTDMKALVLLVVVNCVAAGYSLIQLARCVISMISGGVLFNKALAWAIFSCDQVLAYFTLATVAAAAQASVLGQFGQTQLQWMKVCNLYGKFCNQAGEGLVSAFFVSVCLVTISSMSAFNLFRVYGADKGKSNGVW